MVVTMKPFTPAENARDERRHAKHGRLVYATADAKVSIAQFGFRHGNVA